MKRKSKKWLEYEELASKIQKDLSPTAEVIHNTKLIGFESKKERQIDVLIRQRVGQHTLNIVMECRDLSRKITISQMDGFVQKLRDIRANKGVMVSGKGFSKYAIELAKHYDIDTYSVVDAKAANWNQYIGLPAIAEYLSIKTVKFALGGSASIMQLDAIQPDKLEILDWKQDSYGTLLEYFYRLWVNGVIPHTTGLQKNISLTPYAPSRIIQNGLDEEVHIYATYEVVSEYYYEVLPLINARGFWDSQREGLIIPPNSELTTSWIDTHAIAKTWTRIDNPSNAPKPPMLTFRFIT